MFDDLLNAPYQVHGRGNPGFDCYGLVIECCRRNGTPLKDLWYNVKSITTSQAENDYIIPQLNVRKIEKPKQGCLVEMSYNGHLHAGFMLNRDTVIHATENHGVKTTVLAAVKVIAFYEVI